MSRRIFSLVVSGALVLSLGATLVYASADEVITARQDFMKARGQALRPLVAIARGEAPYDAATVKASLAAIDAVLATVANTDLFPPDSAKGETVETWAKPEIWTDPDGFKAAANANVEAYAALKASTDEASFKAAFSEFGKSCGGCHEKYRRPKG